MFNGPLEVAFAVQQGDAIDNVSCCNDAIDGLAKDDVLLAQPAKVLCGLYRNRLTLHHWSQSVSKQLVKVALPLRSQISEAFRAFVDPAVITKFWLASTNGALAKGATVEWHFMVPGAVETVAVTEFDVDRRIAFTWSSGVNVDIRFSEFGEGGTLVAIKASGFNDGDIEGIVNTTEGFSIVLCDLKTLLESGQSAGLVRSKAQLISKCK